MRPRHAASLDLSVVIPVFNSEELIPLTLDACRAFLDASGLDYEVICVNDGSADGSWAVLQRQVALHPRLVALDLLRNYGQHTAVLCGLAEAKGSLIVTLDDDLQNPPAEMEHLLAAAAEGHDAVFGAYRRKEHGWVRRQGSRIVDRVNTRVFRKPGGLVLSNFRLLRRDVVDRILAHHTHHPYINGLAVLYAKSPINVVVEHRARGSGKSGYDLRKLAGLLAAILFNYSSYPLRVVSAAGLVAATGAFVLGGYFLVRGLFGATSVPGWASVAVMLAFFNGLSLLLLGMLGEHTLRILQQLSRSPPFHVVAVARHDGTEPSENRAR
jgi:glycosyltransferase involved in cell wall biosynthesis